MKFMRTDDFDYYLPKELIAQTPLEDRSASRLLVLHKKTGKILGFMGIEKQKIEMLFIHPTYRGHGIGKQFIAHAITLFNVSSVDVNEQNVQGLGFYKHMGFKVIDRSPTDESGNPFPIVHMHR